MKHSFLRPRGEEASTRSTYEDPASLEEVSFYRPIILGADFSVLSVLSLFHACWSGGWEQVSAVPRAGASLRWVKITSIFGSPFSTEVYLPTLLLNF